MPKPSILAFLLIFMVPTLASASTRPSHVTWAKSHVTGRDTITTLTFYYHNIDGGKDATAIQIVNATGPDKSRYAFGSVVMTDDFLTETLDMNSKLIGRGQGFYAAASMQELGLLSPFTFEFTDGIYNGSSFSVLGKSTLTRFELPVVGGTGLFRWARGSIAVFSHYQIFDGPITTCVVGFNATLVVPNYLKNIT